MKGKLVLIAIVAGMILVGSVVLAEKNRKQSPEELTRVSNGRSIAITVIYLNPVYRDSFPDTTAFYIRMDTHSGSLFKYDLMNLSELHDEKGRTLKPISWSESDKSWDHHRNGVLEFPKVSGKKITLIIKDVEFTREFNWR